MHNYNEELEILDENNISLGFSKKRALVHKDGDWHKSVHIYVLNNKNELLIHLRSSFKDLNPDCWDTRFGGHVLAGDAVEKTVIKELEEEIGIKRRIGDLIEGLVIKWDGKTNREFNPTYYYKFRKGDKIKFNDNEVVKVKWMSFEKILKSIKKNPSKWATNASTIEKAYKQWEKLNQANYQ